MKFPVFLLGLVVSSAVIGIVLWSGGVSFGKSLLWAVVAFGVGQILYVALVAALAAAEKKSRRVASALQDSGNTDAVRGLAQGQDRKV